MPTIRNVAIDRLGLLLLALALLAGCATLPPGGDHPKTASSAFDAPRTTRLGRDAIALANAHPGRSGVHLFARGPDGLVLRTQIVEAAQRALDIQYYIFVEDTTGKLLTDAVLRAANRGVRVRLLVDDLNMYGHPETRATLAALDHHSNIEIRLFNPMNYRGDSPPLHALDLTLNAPRLNHRMHNKLFVADAAVAIVGGRNVADGYFEAGDPSIRFGDFDLAVIGPAVADLEKSFDEFWNSSLAIPQEAVPPFADGMERAPDEAASDAQLLATLRGRIASDAPLKAMLAGRLPLSWGATYVVADPPEKAKPGAQPDDVSPTAREITGRIAAVRSDLVIISPYFVPGRDGLATLRGLLANGAKVRVLTNSLASTDVPAVHAGYRKYRTPLLEAGAEIFEIRPAPGQAPPERREHGIGSGGSSGSEASRAPFALHAKAFVFDRATVFLGSANLDPRSLDVNTEVSLIIESPELADAILARFRTFSSPTNSYRVSLDPTDAMSPLRWWALLDGQFVMWTAEPDTTAQQRLHVDMLSLLPIEPLL
jgi:cardiolipin synthase C